MPKIKSDKDLEEIFRESYAVGAAIDDGDGRVYLRLEEITSFMRHRIGYGINQKSTARDLTDIGFEKFTVNVHGESKRRRVFVWKSPARFQSKELGPDE
jgi:hypothetical protein